MKPCSHPTSSRLFSFLISVFVMSHAVATFAQNTSAPHLRRNAFTVDIGGIAASGVREIEIEDLVIDVRETTTGLDVEYRLYAPGATHWGTASFSVAARSSTSKELKAWYDEAASGKNLRKNITVTLFKSDKSPGRSYTFIECFPTALRPALDSAGQAADVFTFVLKRIELDSAEQSASSRRDHGSFNHAEASSSDSFAPLRGFAVEFHAGGKEVDTAWESISGGERMIDLSPPLARAGRYTTRSPGHKSVETIILRGGLTSGRKALCQWINDTTQGKPWKRNMTVTELLSVGGDGTVHRLENALPRRYLFPRMSVYNDSPAEEQIEFDVIREHVESAAVQGAILDIGGAPRASANALLISVDDLHIDTARFEKEGDARVITAKVAVRAGATAELAEWIATAQKGVLDTRTMRLDLLNARGRELRQWTFFDCFPVHLSSDGRDIPAETLTVKIGRIEFK